MQAIARKLEYSELPTKASDVLTLRAKAKKEYAERILAQRKMLPFAERVFGGEYIVAKHHKYVSEVLEKAAAREEGYTKLVIHLPPQHGKSELITKLFVAWYLGKNPDHPVMLTGYNATLATGFGRAIRNYVASPEYQRIFSNIELAQDSKSAGRWNLAAPHRGALIAAGIQGGLTGHGAKLLVIDDPIKTRDEAENKEFRDKIVRAYQNVLSTRLHSGAVQILVMTRWHKNDLAGWLLQNDKDFRYIRIPAIAESKHDPLHRRPGRALWPYRKTIEELKKQKELIGGYQFGSLYQGDPQSQAGKLFRRDYFQIIPRDEVSRGLDWVRYWDLALGENQKSHFTASARAAMDEVGNVYYDGWLHGRWPWPVVRALIKRVALMEKHVLVGVESAGQQKGMVQELHFDQELSDIGILGVPVQTSKRVRALPVTARGEGGFLFLVKGPWNDMVIDEAVEFDTGDYDDNVDVLSGCMKLLAINPQYNGLGGDEEDDDEAPSAAEPREDTDAEDILAATEDEDGRPYSVTMPEEYEKALEGFIPLAIGATHHNDDDYDDDEDDGYDDEEPYWA